MNIVMFWKQNDTSLYGRRQDMILKYLSKSDKVETIIHFDYPISTNTLDVYRKQTENDFSSEKGLVRNQTLTRKEGRKESQKVCSYTYVYEDKFSEIEYLNYIKNALSQNDVLGKDLVIFAFPRDFNLPKIVSHLKHKCIVVDVIDDQRTWPQSRLSKFKLTRNYKKILKLSDLAFVNCEEVRISMSKYKKHIKLLENGCELFSGENCSWEVPAEFKNTKNPNIGYVGNLLDARLDAELIEKLAKSHPNWNLIFIGSTHNGTIVRELSGRHDNIKLLGVKTYNTALKYINNFDVGIMPHKNNRFTQNLNPLKAFVFASLDVPIVSTGIMNIDSLSEFVHVTENHEEFIEKIESLILTPPARRFGENLDELLVNHSWALKINEMLGDIETVLNSKT